MIRGLSGHMKLKLRLEYVKDIHMKGRGKAEGREVERRKRIGKTRGRRT